jgi:cytochrome c
MRKLPLILFVLFLVSCGSNSSEKKNTGDNSKDAQSSSSEAANPYEEKATQLIGGSDCLTCHQINEASTGPAYKAVAAKYPLNDAVVDSLSEKIIKGGAGNWGTVPMIAHPTLAPEDAKVMVRYILSLK